ncbi:MAG: 50S ribosomal protein L4 [Deltaproteobacteria bacterium]
MFNVSVKNSEGKEIDTIKLDESVFNDKILSSSVYQVIVAFRASQRKGLAATKTRGEVSGGGKKPWKQKGTGRARVGSTRSPLWRHGGVVFGPHPRDFSFSIPKKMKNSALRFVLSEKAKTNNLIVLDGLEFKAPKTKEGVALVTKLEVAGSKRVLVLVHKMEDTVMRTLGNIDNIMIVPAADVTTYDILVANKVVITKEGLAQLTKRIKAG